MNWLESGWKEPDEGLWEVRGGRQHFTHSKVLAWVAADRAVRTVEQIGARRARSTATGRCATRSTPTCAPRATTPTGRRSPSPTGRRRWTRRCCSSRRSASCRREDERVRGTLRAVQRELAVDGMVRRYDTDDDRRRRPRRRGRVPRLQLLAGRRAGARRPGRRRPGAVRAAAGPAQRRRAARRGVRRRTPVASSATCRRPTATWPWSTPRSTWPRSPTAGKPAPAEQRAARDG